MKKRNHFVRVVIKYQNYRKRVIGNYNYNFRKEEYIIDNNHYSDLISYVLKENNDIKKIHILH